MYKIVSAFSVILILASCMHKHDGERKTGLLSNLLNITDNEDKGVKEVLNYYGGLCEYSIGTTYSSNNWSKNILNLK